MPLLLFKVHNPQCFAQSKNMVWRYSVSQWLSHTLCMYTSCYTTILSYFLWKWLYSSSPLGGVALSSSPIDWLYVLLIAWVALHPPYRWVAMYSSLNEWFYVIFITWVDLCPPYRWVAMSFSSIEWLYVLLITWVGICPPHKWVVLSPSSTKWLYFLLTSSLFSVEYYPEESTI